jgi:superfamily II DNA or RNA helicase
MTTLLESELSHELEDRFEEVVRIYDRIEEETGNDYRYQLPAIRHLAGVIEQYGKGFDGSDTGVGKTSVACGVAKVLGCELFVVCPKSVIAPWRRMAKLFDVAITVLNYEALRTGNTVFARAGDCFAGIRDGKEIRRKAFRFDEQQVWPETTLIVFDDCHKMKDHRTWNCLMGLQAIEQGYRVLGASATCADNPMQMKFVALLTGLIRRPEHFWGWMLDNGVRRGRFGFEFKGGQAVLRRIHERIFPLRGHRIRIADLGDLFPETLIMSEAYDMGAKATAEIERVYREMREAIIKLEQRASQDKAKGSVLTEQLRARQRSELLKVPTLVDMAEDAMAEGWSVVLFFNFEDSLMEAAKKLRTTNTITGKDKASDRQNLIDAFNADKERVVLLNIKVSSGITLKRTPHSTPTLALVCPSYSAIDMKQAFGRCWRASGARSVQKVVFAANTVEEKACAKVQRKIRHIDLLNDGDLEM